MLELFILGLVSLLILVLALILYFNSRRVSLEGCGFPVIPPTLFLGSLPKIHKSVEHLEDLRRFQKYGPIWGLYQGTEARVYVADPDLIYQILVKEAEIFQVKPWFASYSNPMLHEVSIFGEKWSLVHTVLTRAFTPSKQRILTQKLDDLSKIFVDGLLDEARESKRVSFDSYEKLSGWLVEVFTNTLLSVELVDAAEVQNLITTAFLQMMSGTSEPNLFTVISATYPVLNYFQKKLDETGFKVLEVALRRVLESQRTEKRGDLLDQLKYLWNQVPSPEFQRVGITETTVLGQIINYFIAFDAVALTLAHTLYYVSRCPESQMKIQAEVDNCSSKEDTPFLEACIKETLRLVPPISRMDRVATQDWIHKGFRLRKGTIVTPAPWAVHRDPDLYSDPNSFRPVRWLGSKRPDSGDKYAFASFSHGPRACPGDRYAYAAIKVFLVHLFQGFEVEGFRGEINYVPGPLFNVCLNQPMIFELRCRSK